MKRARSLSSIFTSEDEVLQVDAGQTDETLAVTIFHSIFAALLLQHLSCLKPFCFTPALLMSMQVPACMLACDPVLALAVTYCQWCTSSTVPSCHDLHYAVVA